MYGDIWEAYAEKV